MTLEIDLLRTCAERIGSALPAADEARLRRWWDREEVKSRALTGAFVNDPVDRWDARIDAHRAHRHPFYECLEHEVTVREYAAFMLENWAYPSFLALVEKTLAVQKTEAGRAAIVRNIADEHVPSPHADLMKRLFLALKARAGEGVPIDVYEGIVDRILVFYYGYYIEPWHLVGSLYATEQMAHHRIAKMGRGLERLGFEGDDLEFIRVHLECDDGHARDWLENVIGASIALDPLVRAPIAEGIGSCLETSGRYLEHLARRIRSARELRSEARDATA